MGFGKWWRTNPPTSNPDGVHCRSLFCAQFAKKIRLAAKELGKRTRLASLELGLDSGDTAGGGDTGFSRAYTATISWRGPKTPLPMENNPRAVFERLFGDGGSADPARLTRIGQDTRT